MLPRIATLKNNNNNNKSFPCNEFDKQILSCNIPRIQFDTNPWLAKTSAQLSLAWETRQAIYAALIIKLFESIFTPATVNAALREFLPPVSENSALAAESCFNMALTGIPAQDEKEILEVLATLSAAIKRCCFKERFERRFESIHTCSSSQMCCSLQDEMRGYWLLLQKKLQQHQQQQQRYLRFSRKDPSCSSSVVVGSHCFGRALQDAASARARPSTTPTTGRTTCCHRGDPRRDCGGDDGGRVAVQGEPVPKAAPQPPRPNLFPGM